MTADPADPELTLLIPVNDEPRPELSIVIPAMNEAITIVDFVKWCHEGLAAAGVRGEILIVDSSSDNTAELAVAGGARVLKAPKRGLGRAYIDALPYVRGKWILMGDADCTYDFRQLLPFVERFREGYEYVMGSRWKGSIEPGSMPWHHQHFGTPLTTGILNVLYSSKFSDIHCGMRGITKDALTRLHLQSRSWEYASELVLKSVHMKLRTAEVPVHFLKDREGRLSHHRREGWWSPFKAAWINLRAMFVYGADFFTFIPGIVLSLVGLAIVLMVSTGPVTVGPVTFSLIWQLFGLATAVLGQLGFFVGVIARILFDYTGVERQRWLSIFRYTRTAIVAGVLIGTGVGMAIPLVVRYIRDGLELPAIGTINYLAVAGLTLIVTGAILFVFTLLIHAAALASRFGPTEPGQAALHLVSDDELVIE